MNRVLLYAPELDGHPRLYCRVICDALPVNAAKIVLALGEDQRATVATSVDLHPLLERVDVTIVITNQLSRTQSNHLTAEEIRNLQIRFEIDRTVFIEADKLVDETWRIARKQAPRFSGTTYGIFANTAEWYPGEDSFTGQRKRLVAHSVRRTLGNIKRSFLERERSPKYYFSNVLLGQSVVDFIITKDERLGDKRLNRVIWMPEISRPKTGSKELIPTEDDLAKQKQLAEFRDRNSGRRLFLYFGDAAFYKGYDLFLELLRRNKDLAGVHPGRLCDEEQRKFYQYDAVSIQRELREQGRLMETGNYVSSEYQKRLYFSCVDVYATTHRLALSSSTMLQAAELERPLLVPDRGLLGHRVAKNQLGETYEYGNVDDLYRKLCTMKGRKLDSYSESLQRFTAMHSDTAIEQFWRNLLLSPPQSGSVHG
jgi:hypothetical protein